MSPFLRRELGEEVRLTGFWAKDDNGKYVIINEEGNVVSDNQVSSGAIKLLMEIHKDALISFFEEEF